MASDRKPPAGVRSRDLRFQFEIDRETDGRWIAEILEVPGAMAYGTTVEEAKAKAYALALYAVADDVEKSNNIPDSISVLPVSA
jgi:predicted RNase H-like HicB family nuclease